MRKNKRGKYFGWWHDRCEFSNLFRRMFIPLLFLFFLNEGNVYSSIPPYTSLEKKMKDGKIPIPYQLAKSAEAKQRGINTGAIYPHLKGRPRKQMLSVTSFNALAILIQFSDKPAIVNAGFFDSLLFLNGDYTLKQYYQEISYGQMDIVTVNLPSSVGWLNVPQSYNYYVNGQNGFGVYPRNTQKMVEDAIEAADSLVDFSRYDNDGDGYVDALFIVHSGPGAEYTGSPDDIWSHQWTTSSPVILDGVQIYSYTTEPEYWISPGDMTCGVYAHEMGHAVFGLPDLYDYGNDSRGLGRWSLMASGSWNGNLGNSPAHPDPWSSLQMGFISPTTITDDTTDIKILPVEDSSVVLKYIVPESNGSEYFLIENRQKIGFDKQLRGDGLLIYHVDETRSDNNNQWYPGNTDNGHYKVALEQADGRWDLEHNQNAGDASDPFPGLSNNNIFNASSVPNNNSYGEQASTLTISSIRRSASAIMANIFVRRPSPRIVLDRSSVDTTLNTGDSTYQSIAIQNDGLATLEFQITCDTPAVWLTILPETGSVMPAAGQLISIIANARALAQGNYQTHLHIKTNDSTRSFIDIPISIIVAEHITPEGIAINLTDGWNLVSNPMIVQDSSLGKVFSRFLSDAYWYDNNSGYQASAVITPGKGYWMKFDSTRNNQILGSHLDSMVIDVEPGWNLIGTISSPVSVSQIVAEPANNLPAVFFEFQKGYRKTDTLTPGRGYWVKVKEKGQFVLTVNQSCATRKTIPNIIEDASSVATLAIQDSGGNTQTLFLKVSDNNLISPISELPPLPPQGIFDIRFAQAVQYSSGTQMQYVQQDNSHTEEFTIFISSASFPLTLRWCNVMNRKKKFSVIEMIDGVRGQTYDLRDSSTIILGDSRITALKLRMEPSSIVPNDFCLEQNYPNPFNPSTTIRFSLPVDAIVTLNIYNEIGQEVGVLFDKVKMEKGKKEVAFLSGNLPSGVYFYRLIAKSVIDQPGQAVYSHYVDVKKMLFLK